MWTFQRTSDEVVGIFFIDSSDREYTTDQVCDILEKLEKENQNLRTQFEHEKWLRRHAEEVSNAIMRQRDEYRHQVDQLEQQLEEIDGA